MTLVECWYCALHNMFNNKYKRAQWREPILLLNVVVVVIQLLALSKSWPEEVDHVSNWAQFAFITVLQEEKNLVNFLGLCDFQSKVRRYYGEQERKPKETANQVNARSATLIRSRLFVSDQFFWNLQGFLFCSVRLFLPIRRLQATALESRRDVSGIPFRKGQCYDDAQWAVCSLRPITFKSNCSPVWVLPRLMILGSFRGNGTPDLCGACDKLRGATDSVTLLPTCIPFVSTDVEGGSLAVGYGMRDFSQSAA